MSKYQDRYGGNPNRTFFMPLAIGMGIADFEGEVILQLEEPEATGSRKSHFILSCHCSGIRAVRKSSEKPNRYGRCANLPRSSCSRVWYDRFGYPEREPNCSWRVFPVVGTISVGIALASASFIKQCRGTVANPNRIDQQSEKCRIVAGAELGIGAECKPYFKIRSTHGCRNRESHNPPSRLNCHPTPGCWFPYRIRNRN